MRFIETRGNDGSHPRHVTFSQAITEPMASYGGLYVPQSLPLLGKSFLERHRHSSYAGMAMDLLKTTEIDIEEQVLAEALSLYRHFDDPSNPAPLQKLSDDLYVCELYHGPTRAFKDMALQPFGFILSHLAQRARQNTLILAATSGDTGPATLETFARKPYVRTVCLYPSGGTSDVQRLQMVTQDASNTKTIGINGDFDDAQAALKSLLKDPSFNRELSSRQISLSAANSVNFGRILFQIIYHFWAHLSLERSGRIALGDPVYLVIPSGNFGNALGAYYARKMGLPVEKILIASNQNHILTDLLMLGDYDLRERALIKTDSPAMDILKSSNVERILFDFFGSLRTRALMESLETHHHYSLSVDELHAMHGVFGASFCDDAYGQETIRKWLEQGYLMDPHTATCLKAFETLRQKPLPTIAYSTAEWTKFAPTVLHALHPSLPRKSDEAALLEVSRHAHAPIPQSITALFEKPIAHPQVIEKSQITQTILEWL